MKRIASLSSLLFLAACAPRAETPTIDSATSKAQVTVSDSSLSMGLTSKIEVVGSQRYIARVQPKYALSGVAEYDSTQISQALLALPAQVYLLDASGSMNKLIPKLQKTRWKIVQDFYYPTNSKVYVFNDLMNTQRGSTVPDLTPLQDIVAQGDTPLYNAIWNGLRGNPESITLAGDGENTLPSYSESDVISQAKGKTKINVVAIYVPDSTYKKMKRISDETGGKIIRVQ